MNRKHKYKDKDEYKDKDKDKDAEKLTESLTVCYIVGILMTFKNDGGYFPLVSPLSHLIFPCLPVPLW